MNLPLLLLAAAGAVVAWPWLSRVSAPTRPVEIGPPPGPVSAFPDAVASLDSVVAYLAKSGRFAKSQADAARVLRAALVEAATPLPEEAAK